MKKLKLRYRLEIARAVLTGTRSGRFSTGRVQPKWYLEVRPLDEALFRPNEDRPAPSSHHDPSPGPAQEPPRMISTDEISALLERFAKARPVCEGCQFLQEDVLATQNGLYRIYACRLGISGPELVDLGAVRHCLKEAEVGR